MPCLKKLPGPNAKGDHTRDYSDVQYWSFKLFVMHPIGFTCGHFHKCGDDSVNCRLPLITYLHIIRYS